MERAVKNRCRASHAIWTAAPAAASSRAAHDANIPPGPDRDRQAQAFSRNKQRGPWSPGNWCTAQPPPVSSTPSRSLYVAAGRAE